MRSLRQNPVIHFIGIGGIGMSGIAQVLHSMGYKVAGSDISESDNTKKLQDSGVKIYVGHSEENVLNANIIVYSSAINNKNPEIQFARKNAIPIMKRAEMLAELMRLYKGVAIAGTHGKTTTTSFLATILEESRFDPTYIIGGAVSNLDGHAKVGSGEYLIAEADESDGSFLLLNPIMSIITNIDNDHLSYYGSMEKLNEAFEKFSNKIPFYGICSLNIDDERLLEISRKIKKPYTTFGINNENAEFEARNIKYSSNKTTFELFFKGNYEENITTSVPGEHNVLNALGAISIAYYMGLSFKEISKSIEKLAEINRRYEILFSKNNLEIVDDYGHHPTEVEKTIQTFARINKNKKQIIIFEPHRFTRTRDCWDEFSECFKEIDTLYLLPIYAASETPIKDITSENLCVSIQENSNLNAILINDLSFLDEVLKDKSSEISLLTLGAGKIGKDIREYIKKL